MIMTVMIIQFEKDDSLPFVYVTISTCYYDTEKRSQRVTQFLSYSFVCCQESNRYITSFFFNMAF